MIGKLTENKLKTKAIFFNPRTANFLTNLVQSHFGERTMWSCNIVNQTLM